MPEQENNGTAEIDSLFSLLAAPQEESNPEQSETLPQEQAIESQAQPSEKVGEAGVNEGYYSEEEFSNLLEKNPLDVEQNRVPKELMPAYKAAIKAYKSFQADYTRKTQKLKESSEEGQPKDIYEAYEIDPEGVINYIDGQIAKAKDDGDLDQVSLLINIKANLINHKLRKIEQNTQVDRQYQEIINYIRQEIPDIQNKAPVLHDFAVKHLGFTAEEIDKLTNPALLGSLAAKLTLAVNRAYELANVDKSLQRKEVRKPPAKLGSSNVSSGMSGEVPAGTIKNMSYEDFEKLLKKVKTQFQG